MIRSRMTLKGTARLSPMLLGLAALVLTTARQTTTLLAQDQYQVVVLTSPSPLTDSTAYGVGSGQTAGTGRIAGSTYPSDTHAVVWPAGTSGGVDLHPAGFRYSAAYDSDGA